MVLVMSDVQSRVIVHGLQRDRCFWSPTTSIRIVSPEFR